MTREPWFWYNIYGVRENEQTDTHQSPLVGDQVSGGGVILTKANIARAQQTC
jgi:hypothetical protein